MKLIVGLGNPGPKYIKTRHNIGFMVIDAQADQLKETWKAWGPGKNSELIQTLIAGEKVLLHKPLTYMNLSGQAVVAAAHFFKILPEDICVIHDDLDLPFGDVRLKISGGDGGHNGLKSISQSLARNEYLRIRMGIGRPRREESNFPQDTAEYVLSPFSSSDWTVVEDMIQRALQAIRAFIAGPEAFKREMNVFNRRSTQKQSNKE